MFDMDSWAVCVFARTTYPIRYSNLDNSKGDNSNEA